MKQAAIAVIIVVAAVLFGAPSGALACTCVGAGPPCQAVFRTDAVFVGTVESIARFSEPGPPEIKDFMIWQQRVHIRVSESFRGDVAREVDVITGIGGGDCGYFFSVGTAYVIYAWSGPKGLATGICDRTAPISQAAADLAFLRSMSATPLAFGKIFGTATYQSRPSRDAPPVSTPFPNVRLSLAGSNTTLVLTSGADGSYSTEAPPGTYEVDVTAPPGYTAQPLWGGRAMLKDPRGCAVVDVIVRDDGRIHGRVVDANSQPVSGLAVHIIEEASRRDAAMDSGGSRTGTDGRFEFSELEANDYVVSVEQLRKTGTRTESSPVVSAKVKLSARANIEIPDITLPASTELARVSGVVVDAGDRPVAGASVYLIAEDEFHLYGPAVITGRDGRFSFSLPQAGVFRISAEAPLRPGEKTFDRVEVKGVEAAPNAASIVVRLIKR